MYLEPCEHKAVVLCREAVTGCLRRRFLLQIPTALRRQGWIYDPYPETSLCDPVRVWCLLREPDSCDGRSTGDVGARMALGQGKDFAGIPGLGEGKKEGRVTMAGRAEPGYFRVVFREDLSCCLLQGFPSKACRWSLAIQSHLEFRSVAQPGACPTPRPSLLPRGLPLGISPAALSPLCERCGCQLAHPEPPCWHLPASTTPAPPAQRVPWAGGSRGADAAAEHSRN